MTSFSIGSTVYVHSYEDDESKYSLSSASYSANGVRAEFVGGSYFGLEGFIEARGSWKAVFIG